MDMQRRIAFASAAAVAGVALAPKLAQAKPHPRLQHAIAALQDAKAELQAAPHDFGGHRAAAVGACENAIGQIQEAMAFAQQHNL
jgi:hypothetical protein